MQAVLFLADGAHAVNGRLYVLGGCVRAVAVGMPYQVVGKIEVDYMDATSSHSYALDLWSTDGDPVLEPISGDPVRASFTGGTGIPPNHPLGMPLDVMFALGAPALALDLGTYEWRLTIDGADEPAAAVRFAVVPPPAEGSGGIRG